MSGDSQGSRGFDPELDALFLSVTLLGIVRALGGFWPEVQNRKFQGIGRYQGGHRKGGTWENSPIKLNS